MKAKKLFLESDDDETVNIALLRLSDHLQSHELFFKINTLNEFQFSRIKDLIITQKYYRYHFLRFEAYHHLTKNCIQILSNKSIESHQIEEQKELFNTETSETHLFNEYSEVDYIVKTSDLIDDFSLILLPENAMFKLQTVSLSSLDERYQIIQYYE